MRLTHPKICLYLVSSDVISTSPHTRPTKAKNPKKKNETKSNIQPIIASLESFLYSVS